METDFIIQAVIERLDARQPHYTLLRRYLSGQTDLSKLIMRASNPHADLLRGTDNLLPSVVRAAASRLVLGPFSFANVSEEEAERNSEVASVITTLAHLDHNSGIVHREAVAMGDAFLLVWPDEMGQVTLMPQVTELCMVEADEYGRAVWGAKRFIDGFGRSRITLYFADRVEKYVARAKSDGSHATKAESYTEYAEEIGGATIFHGFNRVPLFRFINECDVFGEGRSDIEDALSPTDRLVKTLADLAAGQEFYSMPQRFATGLQVQVDPITGRPYAPFSPNGLWYTSQKDAQFGNFSAGDIGQFVTVLENHRTEIGRVTMTPLHYITLTGTPPSGEAQKVAEQPLLNKVQTKQTTFGEVWERIMSLAMYIHGFRMTQPVVNWLNTTPRDQLVELQAAKMRLELGVPRSTILRELDYTAREIREFEASAQKPTELPEGEQGGSGGVPTTGEQEGR